MSRTVFLDFDGVIATQRSYNALPSTALRDQFPERLIVPQLVANVDELCCRAEANVVISSAWRELYPLSDLRRWLAEAGLTARIIGQTPVLGVRRGLEIQQYLEGLPALYDADDIVILEDDEDVSPFRRRQVQTSFRGQHQGFTQRHLSRALRLWGL